MFPDRHFLSAGAYLAQYASEVAAAYASIEAEQLDRAANILRDAIQADATIFCCGNGGSASIANHMVCDHQKGVSTGTHLHPKVVSLSSNVELLTAVSNDIGYEEVFAVPLRLHARKGDVLLAISSSGNSENIVRVLAAAAELGMQTIAMTGFEGGRSRPMADASIHVASQNYGVVEDAHQTCMHVLAQYIRHQAMSPDVLLKHRF